MDYFTELIPKMFHNLNNKIYNVLNVFMVLNPQRCNQQILFSENHR